MKLPRLHLGCGGTYLKGYVNIDLPPSEHTVLRTKADVFADIRTLTYAENSVAEVRNHHVLEHFSRKEALRLLLEWRRWLHPGGLLMVETPDFEGILHQFLVQDDLKARLGLIRHAFGSQEDPWAFHLDGWWEAKYRYILGQIGFDVVHVRKYLHPANRLPNIVVKAKKNSKKVQDRAALKRLLSNSLVGRESNLLLFAWLRKDAP